MYPKLEQAARLLLEIAGPAGEHIEMSATGPAKYYTVPRPITLDDCLKHLRGVKTRGAGLRHRGGMTRALAFDSDVTRLYPGWWWMTGAAQHLAAAGYQVLLEPSPAGRGGHLWIVFNGLVDARAARHHVCTIAPILADVGEYWPGPAHALKWNKVRLPGGRYVSPTHSAWCKLFESTGRELARNGLEAASVLLTYQTPASIVPPLPPDAQDPDTPALDGANPEGRRAKAHLGEQDQAAPGVQVRQHVLTPTPDTELQEKYGEASRFLWFHYTPAQVANWYNARHTVDDLLDFDRTGMASAEALGRPERTPSLGSTRDRQHWPNGVILTKGYLDFAHFPEAQQEFIFVEHVLIRLAQRSEYAA